MQGRRTLEDETGQAQYSAMFASWACSYGQTGVFRGRTTAQEQEQELAAKGSALIYYPMHAVRAQHG